MEKEYLVSASQIFTLFFIMFGPFRVLGPFFKLTQPLAPAQLRTVAFRSVIIAMTSLVLGGFVGKSLLEKWKIPIPILEVTAGLIFAIVAFSMILKIKVEKGETSNTEVKMEGLALNTALSMIITPFGMAVLIIFLAISMDWARTMTVFSMLGLVMLLNLLAMILVRKIMGKVGLVILQVLGAILGVLQAALAVNMIHVGLMALRAS
ncbi:MarC family protein [Bdellovibrio bacteriovorus]|uniref:MarC family protein n=1 Tax=Bdellovibrio bacteriovorus TaxID=959 RepID=UPI0035A6BC19